MKIPVAVREQEAPREVRIWRLKVADRCDRCGAQAFVLATVSETDLLFCGHHFRKHEPALREVASRIVDERERINPRPSSAAY